MGKTKTPKGFTGSESTNTNSNQMVCNSCNSKNPINLVCTDTKCEKSEQLQAICATCHYNLYHSSVSLETYLKKIQVIFQESLAIIEIDQKKLLQFQESLNQTYFMIENLKLKTYEQLQEQENQRQQLLSLLGTIKNLEEHKQPSPAILRDKVREISKILILDPKTSEENPLRTSMNFYREFVYQCEMEIWIKFNRYFSQKRDWVVKTEEEMDNIENNNNNNINNGQIENTIPPHLSLLSNNGNVITFTKTDQHLLNRQSSQRTPNLLTNNNLIPNDYLNYHKDALNSIQNGNISANHRYYDPNQPKKGNGEDSEDLKDEDIQFEIEQNPDDFSEKSEAEINIEEVDDEDDEEEDDDEEDGDYSQYKQRRRKQRNMNGTNHTPSNGQSNQNSQNNYRQKSNSANQRYLHSINNDYNQQSSSHSNGSTAVPKGVHGMIRKIRELSVKEKSQILQEYDQTGDIRAISNKYNIKYRRLYNFIQNSRGPNNQSIRQYSDEDKQLIYSDYMTTNNVREVANKWKLNYDSLYSFIRYKKQK